MFLNRYNRQRISQWSKNFQQGINLRCGFQTFHPGNCRLFYTTKLSQFSLRISSTSKLTFRFSSGVTLLSSAIYSSNVLISFMINHSFLKNPLNIYIPYQFLLLVSSVTFLYCNVSKRIYYPSIIFMITFKLSRVNVYFHK